MIFGRSSMFALNKDRQKINKNLPDNYSFICFSSFETRCLSIPKILELNSINKSYVIRNIETLGMKYNEENVNKLMDILDKPEIKPLNLQKAITVSETMSNIVSELIQNSEKNIVIDISTFTHEALLILMKLLYINKNSFKTVKCLYNGVSNYSYGDLPENMWLSKGCRDVRNVIGYPGKIDSTKKRHLIILTGFEIERATGLVELVSPDILTLGDGSEPTEEEHTQVMKYFRDIYNDWKKSFLGIITESFDFSCRDVEKTVDILKEKTSKKEDNFLLVPLNTKLSTVAVGIAALENPDIQVCYALPEIYNMKNYSEPSDSVTILDMNHLFERIEKRQDENN